MVRSHFYDIDTLININNQAWIVDRDNPSIPIIKLSKSDFSLIENGIYRKQNNKIEFNGKTFWLPTDLYNKLKVKTKNSKVNFSNLAISLQEFLNKEIIDNMSFEINTDIISKVNKNEDIYIICSKQTKKLYQKMIDRIEEEFSKNGVSIKNFYYISENYFTMDKDDVKFKKMRLLLQHLVGYRTDGDKFADESITRYDQVLFYDNEYDTLKIVNDINMILGIILSNTPEGLKEVIKEDIKEYNPMLIVNKINDNKYNQIESKNIRLGFSSLIKTYESFIKFKK